MSTNESKFEYILSNIYNLQHYAEAKNGVLLTLLSGVIILMNDSNIFSGYKLIIMNIAIGIPILILLISFLPRFNKIIFLKANYKKLDKRSFNVLNIQELSTIPKKYITEGVLEKHIKNYLNDLQGQIVENSKIAMKKFKGFSLSMIFSCLALIIFIILII